MKKLWLGILATMLMALFVAPAFAWEFDMTGEFEWRQQYFSRIGSQDLFGDASMQENTQLIPGPAATAPNTLANGYANNFIGFAGPNYWGNGANVPAGFTAGTFNGDDAISAGTRITRGGFSTWGCDAWLGDQRLTFRPGIKVNNAIRVFGVYTVGGLRNKYNQSPGGAGIPPYERYYMQHTSQAAYNTAAIGSWEQVRATIQTPIATFSIGIKDFPFGTGLTFANNTRTDSALMVVPYGPFRLLFALWPGYDDAFGLAGAYSYNNRADRDTKYDYRYGPLVTYENGDLWLGFGGVLGYKHGMKELVPTGLLVLNPQTSFDRWNWLWAAAIKYNNGRFFFNAEAATDNVDTYYNYSPAGVPGNVNDAITNTAPGGNGGGIAGNRYIEMNKWMIETGVLCGPGKLTGLVAWSGGSTPVGTTIANAWANGGYNPTKPGASLFDVNYQVLQPYSFLMFPTYGGGNNRFNADGTGQMSDAYCLAARGDYAAAANLNLWGSYLWAHRVEKNGYYAGSFAGHTNAIFGASSVPRTGVEAQALKAGSGGGFGAAANPFVDDGYLGWEAQAGLDWKLLENMSMQFAYSYWSLGPWFDQAYQVFTPNNLNGTGLMQGRAPIEAVRGAVTITF